MSILAIFLWQIYVRIIKKRKEKLEAFHQLFS